jgi:hypothetical protein
MSGLISVFSSIILLATVSTLAIALFAYIAYKVRERREPEHAPGEAHASGEAFRPVFLKRHLLNDIIPLAHGDAPPGAGDPPAGAGESPITQTTEEK